MCRYIGQRNEASLGLYDYGARMYHPQLGRFVSADSVVPGPTDPQMLNRYSYVRNNPMGYTDPSGHFIALPPMAMSIDKKTGQVHIEAGKPTNLDRLIASLIVGDVNDLVTIVSGYDPIYGEAVPYGSSEWNRTVALAAVPFASRSLGKASGKLAKAAKEVAEDAGKHRESWVNASDDYVKVRHYDKHKGDWGGNITEEQYTQKALNLQNRVGQKNVKSETIGDTLYVYDETANLFGSYRTSDKKIITFYKPTNKKNYWNSQLEIRRKAHDATGGD